jgi:hypothetical protein
MVKRELGLGTRISRCRVAFAQLQVTSTVGDSGMLLGAISPGQHQYARMSLLLLIRVQYQRTSQGGTPRAVILQRVEFLK